MYAVFDTVSRIYSTYHDLMMCLFILLEKEIGGVDRQVPWLVIIAKLGPIFCYPFACKYTGIAMC